LEPRKEVILVNNPLTSLNAVKVLAKSPSMHDKLRTELDKFLHQLVEEFNQLATDVAAELGEPRHLRH
jgi:hypothetical protein